MGWYMVYMTNVVRGGLSVHDRRVSLKLKPRSKDGRVSERGAGSENVRGVGERISE